MLCSKDGGGMKATITIEDSSGRVRLKSAVEGGPLEHLFREFQAAVHDFRNVTQESAWRVIVDLENA
jgi:hypothetical protein